MIFVDKNGLFQPKLKKFVEVLTEFTLKTLNGNRKNTI